MSANHPDARVIIPVESVLPLVAQLAAVAANAEHIAEHGWEVQVHKAGHVMLVKRYVTGSIYVYDLARLRLTKIVPDTDARLVRDGIALDKYVLGHAPQQRFVAAA